MTPHGTCRDPSTAWPIRERIISSTLHHAGQSRSISRHAGTARGRVGRSVSGQDDRVIRSRAVPGDTSNSRFLAARCCICAPGSAGRKLPLRQRVDDPADPALPRWPPLQVEPRPRRHSEHLTETPTVPVADRRRRARCLPGRSRGRAGRPGASTCPPMCSAPRSRAGRERFPFKLRCERANSSARNGPDAWPNVRRPGLCLQGLRYFTGDSAGVRMSSLSSGTRRACDFVSRPPET